MKKSITAIILITLLLTLVTNFAPDNNPFNDVDADKWYYDEVSEAYECGIMIGTSKTTFAPDETVTRAMFITALGRLPFVGSEQINTHFIYSSVYADVKENEWYSNYINWADNLDITTGINNARTYLGEKAYFATNDPVTREQIATFLVRYLDAYRIGISTEDTLTKEFKDKPSEWAADAVERIRGYGIIKGDGNDYFNPKSTATRAEVAAILCRFNKALDNKYYVHPNIDTKTVTEMKITEGNPNFGGVTKLVNDKKQIKKAVEYLKNTPIEDIKSMPPTDGNLGITVVFYSGDAKIGSYFIDYAGNSLMCGYSVFYCKSEYLKPFVDYVS